MAKLKIGLDLDGCWADFNTAVLGKLNDWANENRQLAMAPGPSTFCTWHWPHKWFGAHAYNAIWDQLTPEWWGNLKGLQAEHTVQRAAELCRGEDVYFVTHRPHAAKRETEQWVAREFGLTSDQFTVITTGQKGHLAYALGLDVMVEDKPENLFDVQRFCGLHCVSLLLEQPWNRDVALNPQIQECATMSEALKHIGWLRS